MFLGLYPWLPYLVTYQSVGWSIYFPVYHLCFWDCIPGYLIWLPSNRSAGLFIFLFIICVSGTVSLATLSGYLCICHLVYPPSCLSSVFLRLYPWLSYLVTYLSVIWCIYFPVYHFNSVSVTLSEYLSVPLCLSFYLHLI